MKKKGLLRTVTVILVLFLLTPAIFAGGQDEGVPAAGERLELNVGFTVDEALETMIPDEGWQYTEMGCIFWPLVYQQLWILGPAPDYKPIPMLADSWETEDNQTWIFHLNKDSKFHDGVAVTAEDVAFTLEYYVAAEPTRQNPDAVCTDIQVLDSYTIQFTLEYPLGGEYPPAYWLPILPKHIFEPYKDDFMSFNNAEAIGSGPFKLREFEPGQFIWLEKFDDYSGDQPAVDDVIFKTYGTVETEYSAIKSGEIDMIGYNGIDPLAIKSFEGLEDIEVVIDPGITLDWLTFNLHQTGPISDLEVRKAIMYGIDKQRLIDLAAMGYASPVDTFVYPELPVHNPDLNPYDYNPGKAEGILRDAGYTDTDGNGIVNDPKTGEDLVFVFIGTSDWPRQVKAMKLMKEQLQDIGIGIDLNILDLDTFYYFWYSPTEDQFDIAIGSEEPGPYANWIWEFVRSWNNGGEGWNCAYYNNDEFDNNLNAMLGESDPEKQKGYLFEMQRIVNEDIPYGFLLQDQTINPVRTDKVNGYVSTIGGVSTWINPWSYLNLRPAE